MKAWLFSNLHISICAALFTYGTMLYYDIHPSWSYLLLVFGSTLFLYNAQRLVKARRFPVMTEQMAWVGQHQRLLSGLSILGLLLCIPSYALWLTLITQGWPFFLLAMAYALPIIPSSRGLIGLRDLPFVKIILIAIVWTAVTLWLPGQLYLSDPLPWPVLLERALFIIAITLPFDVRDLPYDHPSMRTIPQLIGIKKSHGLSLFLLFTCVALTLGAEYAFDSVALVPVPVIIYLISSWLSTRSSPGGDFRLYNLGLDGMMGLYGILLLLISQL